MADLPRILCGPILRRCDEKLVTIWLATSFELSATAAVRILDCSGGKPIDLGATSEKQSVRVGKNLYVNLFLARPPKHKTFPRGRLLGYDLALGGTETLDWRTLYYSWLRHLHPTFFLQAEGEGIRIMHGSCRKPYGMGLDALAAADSLMGRMGQRGPGGRGPDNLRVDQRGRPAVLYLTGDQIYADDVETQLFAMIRDLAVKIMGYDEELPVSDITFEKLSRLTYGRTRRNFTLYDVKFTTEDGQGHLLGLSEFAAMYLMVWNPEVWDKNAVEKLPKDRWKLGTPVAADHRKAAAKVRDMYYTLPAVRRALANVPTYMIFDDHDVTDDWNLDAKWFERVSTSVQGRRVVANALAAYWLFQGWGNDPDDEKLRSLQPVIAAFCEAQEKGDGHVYAGTAVSKTYEDTLWNFHDWGFAVKTDPPTIFVDMRTQRVLYPRGTGPALLNKQARRNLRKLAKAAGHVPNMTLILISSAPVFNISGLELGQKIQKWRQVEIADLDYEQWSNNRAGKHVFLRTIIEDIKPACCIFLSGEVHFGLTAGVDYYIDPPMREILAGTPVSFAPDRCGRFIQLTSSPLKNETDKVGKYLTRKGLSDIVPGLNVNEEKWILAGVQEGLISGADVVSIPDLILHHWDERVLWLERGENIRDNGGAYAPIEGKSNLGVVTIQRRSTSVVHEFCVVPEQQERYAPDVAELPTVISCVRSTRF